MHVVDMMVMIDMMVDMMVMMDMMVDVTRGCLYTTHACQEGGHLILDLLDMLVDKTWVLLCACTSSVGDVHDGLDGGHY